MTANTLVDRHALAPVPVASRAQGTSRFSRGRAVPPVYETSTRRRTWGELEGWRIIAALGIVAIHVWQHSWGLHPGFRPPPYSLFPYLQSLDLFVDLFFVISGLVLAYPFLKVLLDDPHRAQVDSFRGFMVQRFLRVAPAYYAILIVVWSIRNFGVRTADWLDLVEHLTFTQWLDPERIFFSIGPAWSIAVEFWMYMLIPGLFFATRPLIRRIRRRSGRVAVCTFVPVLLIAVSSAFKILGKAVWHVPYTNHAYWYSMPSKLDDFGIGILLALVVAASGGRRIRLTACLLCRLAGIAGLVAIVARRYHADPVAYFNRFEWFDIFCHTLASLAFALLLIPAVLGARRDPVNRVIGARPFVVAGAFTYALYLLHEPLLTPLTHLGILGRGSGDMVRNWFTVLPISFVLAVALYLLIEWPMVRIRASFDRRTGRSRDYYPHLADVHVTREGPVRLSRTG
jgi:peptidoglycan/LPS O-acetylase OafA/YrhL